MGHLGRFLRFSKYSVSFHFAVLYFMLKRRLSKYLIQTGINIRRKVKVLNKYTKRENESMAVQSCEGNKTGIM